MPLPFDALTPGEVEVLALYLDGLGYQGIMAALGIARATVKRQLYDARDKCGGNGAGYGFWIRVARELGRAEGRDEVRREAITVVVTDECCGERTLPRIRLGRRSEALPKAA